MKAAILAVTLFTTVQSPFLSDIPMIDRRPMPITTIMKGPDGQIVGTATISGNTTYYRDAKGELTGSSRVVAGGDRIFYDAHGKVIGHSTTSGNVTTMRDAEGNVTGTTTIEGDTAVLRDPSGKIIGKSSK